MELINNDYSGFVLEAIAQRKGGKDLKSLTGCKRPLLNVGKKKKAYETCISNFKQQQQDALKNAAASKAEAEEAKAKLAEVQAQTSNENIKKSLTTDGKKKFLGMEQNIGITVVVGASALVLFIGYKILTRNKTA